MAVATFIFFSAERSGIPSPVSRPARARQGPRSTHTTLSTALSGAAPARRGAGNAVDMLQSVIAMQSLRWIGLPVE